MKCTRCRGRAVVEVPRANAGFCGDCFTEHYVRNLVSRAIRHDGMFGHADRVLIAVSGGKDSLALWDLLLDLGYQADGLYLGLGIGGYSSRSQVVCQEFADARSAKLVVVDVEDRAGFTIPQAAATKKRPACAVCGLSKRHLFNAVAREHGYDVVATGHNLDDEAAVLLGNTMRWEVDYLARQLPVLAAREGFPKKVKPLVRLTERETAAWCIVRGIDYLVDECPMALGNKHLAYKSALNAIDETSPGTKAGFYFNFIDKMAPLLAGRAVTDGLELGECSNCGAPTTGNVCAFCHLVETASAHVPVPVELVMKKGRGKR